MLRRRQPHSSHTVVGISAPDRTRVCYCAVDYGRRFRYTCPPVALRPMIALRRDDGGDGMNKKRVAGARQASVSAQAAEAILALSRETKRLIMATADAVAIPTALWAALALKFDRLDPALDRTFAYFLVAVASALFFFSVFGLYRAVIRFVGPKAMITVIAGVSLSVLVLAGFDRFVASHQIPLSAFGIYGAFALLYVGGSRFVARALFLHTGNGKPAARVAIYGAGDAGARVSSVLLGGPDFEPVAFIDDKRSLQGSIINGIQVYGSDCLPELVRRRKIDRVLLALPSASRRRRREILTQLEPLGVHVQSLPNLSDLISGKAQINELRDVDVGDLLGRDPVPPNPKLFGSGIRGKCVLVTVAGGSIGSELCRQILRLSPSRLVLFEMSELALYRIQRELEELAAHEKLSVEVVPLLGNAHHRHRVREVLSTFGVQTIYHAAAYKHVPIVEHNVVEGVHNNVISTWYTAEAAIETGVETFVLVSTDKAVNPANVRGATKRLPVPVLQALQERSPQTRFCMVRFGNVLASSGSVVPLFQEQILHDLLVALASFDCHDALELLTTSVAEYQADTEVRDYVWTRKAVSPHALATNVADFAAKRRLSEAAKPTQGQNPLS